MNNSSLPQSSLDDLLNDTITLSSSSLDTIVLNGSSSSSYYTNNITVPNGGISNTGTISGFGGYSVSITGGSSTYSTIGAGSSFNWGLQEEFVNCMPEFNRIEKMCNEYPGLKIAFEKFKTTYRLVKDDYDNPKDRK